MRFVKQKHKNGCVIAALAMLTGATYEAVAQGMGSWFSTTKGVVDGDLLAYLIEYGHAFRINLDGEDLDEVQLAIVQESDKAPRHAVIVMPDGSVLDPAGEGGYLSDYEYFHYGVVLV